MNEKKGNSPEKKIGGSDAARWIVQPCIKPKSEIKEDADPPLTIRVCVFFDGTFNNRTNVDLGAIKRAEHPGETNLTDGSYDNDHTNIDKLQKIWLKDRDADLSFSVYVEGIGTLDEKDDDTEGAAFGTGKTGILAKVDVCIAKILINIKKKAKNKNISYLYLDAFGFSRGAAAARYFVYSVLENEGETLENRLFTIGYLADTVKVKFIGLFDTVAAYRLSHKDDTEQLHLDSIKNAERVVQLAAADEYRVNFSLTNIDSAPNRLQIFLPGSHSDIGGGYSDDCCEDFTIFYYKLPANSIEKFTLELDDIEALNREIKWLIRSGWYLERDVKTICPTFSDICSVKVNRSNIKNKYSNVTLQLMANLSYEYDVHFASAQTNQVPAELNDIAIMINEYATGLGGDQSKPEDWNKSEHPELKKLRYKYLHFSSQYFSYFGANDPHFTRSDPKSGERKRIIQNG